MSKLPNLLSFKPATLCKGKVWYVVYYALNPANELLERHRIRINHIKPIEERLKYGKLLVKSLNIQLAGGWSPYNEENSAQGNKKLIDTINVFLKSKLRELRPDSVRTYKSYINILEQWLTDRGKENIACEKFKKIDAINFLEDCYNEKTLSGRTYNNYRLFYTGLWNWLLEREYVSENCFLKISKRTDTGKQRIVIDPKTREEIRDYLQKNDYDFLIVALLVFHTLIRPKEICYLKPENFELFNQIIRIPASVAKNKHERIATIPNALMPYLVGWDFRGAAKNQYILGHCFMPSNRPLNPRRLSQRWDVMRKTIGFDKKMQLYSLRDTGIVQMIRDGVSLDEVMRQADHSSLDITTIYVKLAQPKASDQLKEKVSSF